MLSLLDPAVPLTRVAAHVKKRWRQHQRVELELSLGLRRLFRDCAHRGNGTGNFATYAEREFDIPPKLTWTFSNLGEHLERLPMLVTAMESGEVTYTKAREFAPYIQPEDQREWIEFARKATNRAIESRVAKWNADRLGKEYVEKKKVTSSLNGLEAQAVRQAREQLLKATDQFIPETKLLPALATMLVEGKLGTAEDDSGKKLKASKTREPYLAIAPCPCCLTTFVPVPGANMPVAAFEFLDRMRKGGDVVNLIPHYFCDCENELHRRDECPRLRGEKIAANSTSRYVSAEAQQMIDARDGFRCRVPGCLNQLPLENGHIHKFCEGGPTTPKNMATQCKSCNALIEEESLVVIGIAPYEKYYLRDGTFLGWGFNPTPFNSIPHVGQGDGSGRVAEIGAVWANLAVT